MAQRLQSLRNDRELARFVLEGRATGKQLGIGSYGSVEEVVVKGLVCAGKKIHELLLDAGNVGVRDITQKYLHECQLMSDLRHPNITLFLGVCFLPNCQLPVLLMERLDGSLDNLLETVPNIPLTLKQSMLEDVARGLLYLHTHNPQIIHRDLTAKNVLLTSSLVAKITDFGNSRIVNLQPGQLAKTMSRLPGTQVYMPPEAVSASCRYGPSLDIFSFGHLALFTITQVFPGNLLESTHPDPSNPDQVLGRSEVERRREYIDMLKKELRDGDRHPLTQLVKQCLRNDPSRRPATEQIVTELQGVRADTEGDYGELAKLDAVRQVVIMKRFKQKEAEAQEKTEELRLKCEESHQLQLQLQQAQTEANRLENSQQQKERQLQEKDLSLQQKDEALQQMHVELQRTLAKLQQKTSELLDVQQRLHRLQVQSQELKIPLSLRWRQVSSMPLRMCDYPQTVVMNEKVYVGGRWAKSLQERRIVTVYDPQKDVWDTLPPYSYSLFAMASVNNQLVLIGGRDEITSKSTAVVGAWNEESKSWTDAFPPMPTARLSPTIASYDKWLVAIGGRLEFVYAKLSEVEILDTALGQWYCAAPLPEPYSSISPVVIGYTCYVLGGFASYQIESNDAYSVCLDDLISQAISQQPASAGTNQTPPTPSPWQVLPNTPLSLSTAFTLKGALLAVGGVLEKSPLKRGLVSRAIYVYRPGSRTWIKAGELQTGRAGCACTLLPSGEILVTGGTTETPEAVEIGTVTE